MPRATGLPHAAPRLDRVVIPATGSNSGDREVRNCEHRTTGVRIPTATNHYAATRSSGCQGVTVPRWLLIGRFHIARMPVLH